MTWGAWVLWTALGVRSDAAAARDEARVVRSELDARSLLDGEGLADLAATADRFAAIRARLGNPLLAPIRVLPVVGRQLSAAADQADAAATGLDAAAELGAELSPLLDGGLGAGPDRVETLREVATTVERHEAVFEDLDLGPDRALLGSLSSARQEIDEARAEILEGLDRTVATSLGLADFFEGPSDYLLLAANNAQMQNGQGMFLSAGVLHLEDGRMDVGPMQSLARVPDIVPPVPLDPDLVARWGWLDPNLDVRHLGLSHRFPVTAATASAMWEALGHPPVDGVLAVDAVMLQAITEATGPVETSAGTLRPGDVLDYILHGQYLGYLNDGLDRSYSVERRDELDQIARTVLHTLEDVDDFEPEVLEGLVDAAEGRHLLMWSKQPTVQEGVEAARLDGQISPESTMVSLVNRSAAKLDWYVQTSSELSIERHGDHYEAVLDVGVTNNAPASGQPRYVVGPYPGSGLQQGEYLGLVTLNLPAASANSTFVDQGPLAVAGADGENRTIAAWVHVQRGTTVHLVATFELPLSTEELVVEPSGRAFPTVWSYDGGEWTDRERRTLEL